MAVKLLFFAQAARWAGSRQSQLELSGPSTVAALLERPELSDLKPHTAAFRVAVNCEYAEPSAKVQDGDEVAFLPPYSGG
jgi:MoaE-MoaD fusion protein